MTTKILTLDEACGALRISRRTIGRLIDAGEFIIIRLSPRRYGIEETQIDAYIARHRGTAQICQFGTTKPKSVLLSAYADADRKLAEFCRLERPAGKRKKSTQKCSPNSSTSSSSGGGRVIRLPTR